MTVRVELSDVIVESETRSLSLLTDLISCHSNCLSVIYIHRLFFQIFFIVTNKK
jgi:hypothetical protein